MAVLTDLFTNIANAIRAKSGESSAITATDFPAKINSIPVATVFEVKLTADNVSIQDDRLKNKTSIIAYAFPADVNQKRVQYFAIGNYACAYYNPSGSKSGSETGTYDSATGTITAGWNSGGTIVKFDSTRTYKIIAM